MIFDNNSQIFSKKNLYNFFISSIKSSFIFIFDLSFIISSSIDSSLSINCSVLESLRLFWKKFNEFDLFKISNIHNLHITFVFLNPHLVNPFSK